jgi:hypothetical protein
MTRIRIAAVLFATCLVAGCGGGSSTPSASPSSAGAASPQPPASTAAPSSAGPQGAFATGCLNLGQVDCINVRDLVLATLAADAPAISYVEVGPFACVSEPCPESIQVRPNGRVTIEYADGSDPTVFDVSVQAGEVATKPARDEFLVGVLPSSPRLSEPQAAIDLGHCGLLSGIDVDGSFWDPVGRVDMMNQDAINAAKASFLLISPATARLTTAGGLELDLVRHPGGKHLPPCM